MSEPASQPTVSRPPVPSFRMMLDTPAWRGALLSAILLLTAFTYRGVTANGYVLDDAHLVASNPSIVSFASAGRWFTTPYATSALREHPGYRPIVVASYALDRALWPNPSVGYHRTNLLIHLVAVVLVALLARPLWADGMAALTAAAVMALHPINAEAINYLSARSSSLAAMFVLTAIWAYDRAVGPSHGRGAAPVWFGTALVASALALGTKEIAVVLPVLILAWDRARFGDQTSWRTSVTRSLPFWAVTAAFLVVRSIVMGQAPMASAGASGQTALFAMKIVLASFGQWIVPLGLAVDHGWPWTIGAAEAAWLSLGLAAAVVVTTLGFRYDRRIGWCLIWSWGALAPLAALPLVSRVTLYQDHRVYLAGIGLAWAVGGFIAAASRARSGRAFRWIAAAVAAVLVTAMIRADLARSAVWVDETRLWEDVLSKYPNSVVALNARGLRFLNAGRFDEAERDFQTTLRLVPGSSEAHKNLGLVYAETGDLDRAVREMNAALAISPGSPGILVELGLVYERAKDWESAKLAYEQVLQSSPGEVLALKGLARAAERDQRFDEAARRYRDALAVDPQDDHGWLSLGAVLVRLEHWSEARDAFTAVLSRHPGSPQARFNLGVALDGLGDAAAATQAYAQAAASLPRDADLAFRIGVMHTRHGRWAEAAAAYEDALRRDPRHAAGHLGLARAAEQLGDPQRALIHYRAALASEPPNASAALREQATAAIKRLEGGKGR